MTRKSTLTILALAQVLSLSSTQWTYNTFGLRPYNSAYRPYTGAYARNTCLTLRCRLGTTCVDDAFYGARCVRSATPTKGQCEEATSLGSWCPQQFGQRYYYNAAAQKCMAFYYLGCGGTRNNFKTKSECESTCLSKSTTDSGLECSLPADSGTCYGYRTRYYYNPGSKQCQSFVYGGCGGNANNFASLATCQAKCVTKSECSLPADRGPCYGYMTRYRYNTASKQCQSFLYGGCGGNANNFVSMAACQAKCGVAQTSTDVSYFGGRGQFTPLQGNAAVFGIPRWQPTGAVSIGGPIKLQPARTCATMDCPFGHTCVEKDVQCIRAPCPKVSECILSSPEAETSSETECTGGQVLQRCVSPCKQPTCRDQPQIHLWSCLKKCGELKCACPPEKPHFDSGVCKSSEECGREREENQAPTECPPGQVYKECPFICKPTCEDPNPECTDTTCPPPGCECSQFTPIFYNNKCISAAECPSPAERTDVSTETADPIPVKKPIASSNACPIQNQVYTQCSSNCDVSPSCQNPEPRCNTRICGPPRCECPKSAPILYDGKCITIADCKQLQAVVIMPMPHKPPQGHGTNGNNNQGDGSMTVLPMPDKNVLPASDDTVRPACPIPGQVWKRCTLSCDAVRSCDNPNPACANSCGPEGCECSQFSPYLHNGTCVSACPDESQMTSQNNECPIPGQQYQTCASMCPATCEMPNPICIKMCAPAQCQCVHPTPILKDGRCISEAECPTPSPLVAAGSCSGGMEWVECSSPCTKTCDNLGEACMDTCGPAKCQCPTGTVLHLDQCIPADKCPSS
ncbi:papilin isoform X2 [Lingula anatina]|uniref:Papilin isoform X2 n=1 Tax=Lingula anatina TaxID=7574 RepID=A0A1S3J247_LINAN|nr:papilin isoform X2 [Lingula anatina]|eukprot:XP_013404507.1 papilin isoform X2 [Lingula anatina]